MMRQHWHQQKLKLRQMSVFRRKKKSHYSLKLNNIYLLNPSFTPPPPPPPPPEFPMPLFQLQPLRRIYNFTCQTSASYIFTSSPWQRSSPACIWPGVKPLLTASLHYNTVTLSHHTTLEMGKEIYSGSTMSTCSVPLYTVYSVSAAHVASLF